MAANGRTSGVQAGACADQVALLLRSVEYAKERYEAGYAPYLEQLDAQRNLYQTEIDVINFLKAQLLNRLSLYQALGGGWSAGPSTSS